MEDEKYGQIKRQEWRWVICFSLGVLLLTSIPYLVGYFNEGEHWRFSGFVFGVEDGNSYIAKMLRGAGGDWLFRTPYTVFPQKGVLAFFPYLLLGKLAASPGLHGQLVAVFHLFRWLAGLFCMLATYRFLAIFIRRPGTRRLGLVLASVGGGLGGLTLFGLEGLWAGRIPLEFYSPESFGFLALYGLPHLALGRGLLLWGLGYVIDPDAPQRGIFAWGGRLAWLLLGFAQPLTLVTGWLMLVGTLVITWLFTLKRTNPEGDSGEAVWRHALRKAAWLLALSFPWVIYSLASALGDPFIREWMRQNILGSPPPGDYLLAYGLFIPAAIWGGVLLWKKNRLQAGLGLLWLTLFFPLAYFPTGVQRRLPDGIWICLLALGMVLIEEKGVSFKRYPWPVAILLLVSFLPTLVLLTGGVLAVIKPAEPLFISTEKDKAFQYFRDEVQPGNVVLASKLDGNALPAWTQMRVVIGHGPESINASQNEERIRKMYQSETSDQLRWQTISDFKACYIYWGEDEKKWGGWNPATTRYLRPVFQAGQEQIFKVTGVKGNACLNSP